MPHIPHIECRLKGHRLLCEQDATLLPEGGGLLLHKHKCLRCGKVEQFDTEDLAPELDAMLRMTFRPSTTAVTIGIDPGFTHKPLLH